MKYALVIGDGEYEDAMLTQLQSPAADTEAFAGVLRDPRIGDFDRVILSLNEPEAQVRRRINAFFAEKKPEDLVLLYFSGHGMLDDRGQLYLAVKDTEPDKLHATGIPSVFIIDEMDDCRSKRQVLVLDCCYGGAFERRAKGRAQAVTKATFEGTGREPGFGRVVLTASASTQFALDGEKVIGQAGLSLFTHYLVEGLRSGAADRNKDGVVTLTEWYDYTYEQVKAQTSKQVPRRWDYNLEGDLVIAKNPNGAAGPSPNEVKTIERVLPAARGSPALWKWVRLGAGIGLVFLFVLVLSFLNWNPFGGRKGSPTQGSRSEVTDAGTATAFTGPTSQPPGGTIIDSMGDAGLWRSSTGRGAASAVLSSVPGYQSQAIQLKYDLGSGAGAYVQMRRDFPTPLNLSAVDHLRFFFKGTAVNTLEVGLVTDAGNYFATGWNRVTQEGWWAQGIWDLRDFRKDGQPLAERSSVRAIFISVVRKDGDEGGEGSLAVDELTVLPLAARSVPAAYEMISTGSAVEIAQHAADWVNSQQALGGLVKSWQEEPAKKAWLYDQALALMVLMEKYPASAQKLYARLHALQNGDGSWYDGYDAETQAALTQDKPVSAVSWVVYALARYSQAGGPPAAYQDAQKGAAWLAGLQRADGSLPGSVGDTGGAPTEPGLIAWWAFQAAGDPVRAGKLRDFLLNQAWDDRMGRFLPGPGIYTIDLVNQTWGAAFLHAVGRDQDARRALSYACATLAWSTSDKTVDGFDGAGPFSVWVDGTLQYAAAHGQNSAVYFDQMTGLQNDLGSMPGSPDTFRGRSGSLMTFSGYSVWLTNWHGVGPTAWLYFAATGGPFQRVQEK